MSQELQVRQENFQRYTVLFQKLVSAYPSVSITPVTVGVYAESLLKQPIEILEIAIPKAWEISKFFPTISEILDICKEETARIASIERERKYKEAKDRQAVEDALILRLPMSVHRQIFKLSPEEQEIEYARLKQLKDEVMPEDFKKALAEYVKKTGLPEQAKALPVTGISPDYWNKENERK